ncbi:sirohydrochlorin chelatase [Cytobacillus sp. FJAT-54145]|uniref:Sirohydrochlorin chelatase n=1 Tax=Cytobacillus spartinae TaxID=3299023 RepID=A0ABW6KCU9_9BACI
MQSIIFIGHGSRAPKGTELFVKFISEVIEKVEIPIKEYCFFERYEPNLDQAIESCITKGGTEIIVVPVLLLPGVQTNVEIPEILKKWKQKYPEMKIKFGEPMGNNPIMADLLKERLERKSFSTSGQDAVLLVTHGSHDPQADQEFKRMAEWFSSINQCTVEVAYLTTPPLYKDKAEELLRQSFNKIYVIPYLLFAGVFLESMAESIESNPGIELCDEIGYDGKLKELLIKRIEETKNHPKLEL